MSARPHGSTLVRHAGRDFAVWRARLRDEMPHADGTANPLLWWAMDLESRDMLACGVETKRAAMLAVTEEGTDR